MQIASEMAGFTMGEADTLRRAMGKKDRDLMAKQREKFIAGCK
jgi:DNA polymerase-3 subunit alpha